MQKPFLIRQFPNMLTLSNLAFGCIGIILASQGQLEHAAWCIAGGLIADFFDGFAARLLKVKSDIGGDLDSLSDMVTFGVLPGVIAFQLLAKTDLQPQWLCFLAFVVTLFSAVRLAIFNNDPSQALGFKGVPTPLNALMIGSWPFIAPEYPEIFQPYVILVTLGVLAWLLVSPLRLMALKFTSFALRDNVLKYLFLLLSGISLVLLHFLAVPVIFGLYLLLSIANRSSSR